MVKNQLILSMHDEKTRFNGVVRINRPAFWLVTFVLILSFLFYVLDIPSRWDNRILFLALNILLVVNPAFFIAVIASLSYVKTGSRLIFWLGAGTFSYGLSILTALTVGNWTSTNTMRTIFTIFYMIAGALFLTAAKIASQETTQSKVSLPRRRVFTLSIYSLLLIILITVSYLSFKGTLPVFFIDGQGSTDVQIVAQGIAIALFLTSGIIFFTVYRLSGSILIQWFGLALILTVINAAGNLLLRNYGTPFNWILRIAQLLAGVYLIIAARIILKKAHSTHLSPSETLVDLLSTAESRLKESEERFLKAFYFSPVAQTIASLPEGRWVDANESFLTLVGYSIKEVIGSTSASLNIIGEAERTRIMELFKEKDEVRDYEVNIRTKLGLQKTIISSNEKIILNGKQHALSTMIDITERKKAEEALSHTLQHLNAHLENSPLAVIEFDPQFVVIRWSAEATKIFGWSNQAIVGRSISEMKWVYEDDVNKVDQVSRGFSSGETTHSINVNRNYREDGSVIWCEWYNSSIYDSKGNLSSVLSQVLDITARKKAEEALVESEAKARALIKYAPTGIYEIDFRGPKFLTVNDAVSVLTGYSTEELLAIGPMGMLDDDSRKTFADRIKRQLAGEKINETVEYRVKKKDGSTILVELHITFSAPNPHTVLVIGYDVTERRRAEDALKQYATELEAANKELESFAYSLSHDLRAPLRTLDGFSQAVLDDYGDKLDTAGKDHLTRVRNAAQQMAQITEDMLKLSRVTRSELRVEPLNLSNIVSEIDKGLSEKTPVRKIEFIIAPDLIVEGDPSLMQIALYNLLDNAWKFTSKSLQARIEFGADFRDHETVYFVRDNGIGIDMKYAGKLFQPFQRLHSDKDFPGTGIGLATVQRVIKRHGGKIWIESELGIGTTIYFTLGFFPQDKS
jgi:PAS domain S-box-containing protein